jgi:hypothetical protein
MVSMATLLICEHNIYHLFMTCRYPLEVSPEAINDLGGGGVKGEERLHMTQIKVTSIITGSV